MQKFLRLFLLLGCIAPPLLAQRAVNIGDVNVNADSKTIPVRVSASTPELNALAHLAFKSHGRYRLPASGPYAYEMTFTAVGAQQVRVDVTKGSARTPVVSETVSGTSARNALLRAANVAVEKTNGLGLKGFFTARLAFISERTGKPEIYTSDLFCGEVKQLTHDNASALMPRWSPDGSRIVYTSYYKSGFPDIYLIDLAQGRRDTFISVKGTNQGARFSPNGRQVAMVLSGTGNSEIWMTDAQGHNPVRKTRSDTVKSSPCFSPDGSRLVFASQPGPQLFVMSVNGGDMRRVTTGISGYCAEPDWCRADPNKIAFTMLEGRRYQIAVLDLASGRSEKVSNATFDGVEPSWLADGRHLVYTARDSRTSYLCILDTETGASTSVSQGLGSSALQASVWTP
jgi:TolB protein